jgi:deoxycytidine triphosphate deaminase
MLRFGCARRASLPLLKLHYRNIETMAVKSDRWIRHTTEEHQLIHPFEATLMRESGGDASSPPTRPLYGYDMRLADDGFRVFSPIHSRKIDPKNFVSNSYNGQPRPTHTL